MEIKFRIYDKGNKHFINKGEGQSLSDIVYLENNGIIDTQEDNYIFQQYVGQLEDDTEIYEGDIMETDRSDSFPSWNRGIVIYAESACGFYIKYLKDAPKEFPEVQYSAMNQWDMEVIGNIFENPELLK